MFRRDFFRTGIAALLMQFVNIEIPRLLTEEGCVPTVLEVDPRIVDPSAWFIEEGELLNTIWVGPRSPMAEPDEIDLIENPH